MNKKINFAGPIVTEKEVECVIDATINGFYDTNNVYVKKLEDLLCKYNEVKYSFATPCCTSAMHVACMALGLKKGDEVICTDISWASTSFVIDYTGATPVFVDIDPKTWCICPEAIERAITPKTKAVMLVHMFGHPAKMDDIMEITNKYNIAVIEDAAPAMGSTFKNQKAGTFGDFGCFSFHGAKLTVSGQGGAYITNNEELFNRAKLLSTTGRTDSQANFWCDVAGYHYEISNICAALAYAQISRIEELINVKREIHSWYKEQLKEVEGLDLLEEQKDCYSNYCYPCLFVDPKIIKVSRDQIIKELEVANIHARNVFPRMSRFPMHEQRFDNPIATIVEKQGMNLPSSGRITKEDVSYVCETLIKVANKC